MKVKRSDEVAAKLARGSDFRAGRCQVKFVHFQFIARSAIDAIDLAVHRDFVMGRL